MSLNPGTSAIKFESQVRCPSTTLPLPLKYPSSPLNRSEKPNAIVENKIQITKAVDHHRRVRQRDEPGRLIPLNVEMLAPGIERRREHAAFLPFECLLAAAFGPNAGRAAPLDHVDQLFEEVALRQGLALRRDFTRVTVTTASGADQLMKAPKTPLRFHGPSVTVVRSSMASPL